MPDEVPGYRVCCQIVELCPGFLNIVFSENGGASLDGLSDPVCWNGFAYRNQTDCFRVTAACTGRRLNTVFYVLQSFYQILKFPFILP